MELKIRERLTDNMRTFRQGLSRDNHIGVWLVLAALAVALVAVFTVPGVMANYSTTRTVAENTLANTDFGTPVTFTDPEGLPLTYSLEGVDAASFYIVGSTGQLRTLAALDFETKTAYSVVVRATDPGGLSGTIDVTINVTDVEDTTVDLVDRYSTNGTEGIQIDELLNAIDDYFASQITKSELFEVIDAYFS